MLAYVGVVNVMTFFYYEKVYLRQASRRRARPRRASPRRPTASGSDSDLDTVTSASVMLCTSDHEQDPTSPRHRQSTDKVEPVLEGDVDLTDFLDEAEHELELLREADVDALLEDYRASQRELLGCVPLPTPSATALADGTEDGDAIDSESDTSGSDDDEPEPTQGMEAACLNLLGFLTSLLFLLAGALADSLFARWY